MATPVYRFLPWARRGLAQGVANPDTGAPLPARASIQVDLDVAAGTTSARVDLYGPGEVTGIDRRMILRTDPAPAATDFEPNYLAMIEFDPPDFPWMFTPAAAAGGRLRPWCVLIVVQNGPGVTMSLRADAPLPVLTISKDVGQDELPHLAESWAWAHAQLLEENGTATTIGADPERDLSRLVCPRRLKPNSRYRACVVPAFDLGVARGLGQVAPSANAKPAWTLPLPEDLRLPVYYFWEFSTAVEDDIESMARRLHGPEHAPPDLGRRRIYAAAGHPDLHNPPLPEEARVVTMHGALRQIGDTASDASTQHQELSTRLAGIVDQRTPRGLPAPLYGEWPAAQHTVVGAPAWMAELDATVAHRIAAGLGAEVLRRNQEGFVQAAWDQVGEVRSANELAQRARLAAAVLDRLMARHIAPRPDDRLIQLTGPALAGTAAATATAGTNIPTIAATLDDASLPTGATSAAYRRLASGQRQAVKLAVRRAGLRHRTSLIGLTAADAALTEPMTGPPDGVTDLRDLAALQSADRSAVDDTVSLAALGLGGRTEFANVAGLNPIRESLGSLPTTNRRLFTPSEVTALISTVTGRPAKAGENDPPIKRPPRPITDVPALKAFSAALAVSAMAANRASPSAKFLGTDVRGLGARLRDHFNPRVTVARRANAMVTVPAPGAPIYDPFRGIQAFPVIGNSTYQYLDQLDNGWILPQANGLEPDTAILLRTNSDFTAAFLVGLNHEMNSELLWRGYPTDQRGTPFQHFWDRFDDRPDILPIHQWDPAAALSVAGAPGSSATNSGAGDQIVLLIRGKLLQRYPDMVIYATQGTHSAPGTSIPTGGRPMFFAHLSPDLSVVGFPLTPAQLAAAEWWFVLEQQLTAPRFGFDADVADTQPPPQVTSWADVSWSMLDINAGRHIRLNDVADKVFGGRRFGSTADQIAATLLQRPVRVALHRDRLLTHPAGTG